MKSNCKQQRITTKRGWLRNGNVPGDLSNARPCGARTRSGGECRSPAMANGRCRMHGGASTGPRTPAGLARSRRANWKHGRYSAEARALRKRRQWEAEIDRWEAEQNAWLDQYDDEALLQEFD